MAVKEGEILNPEGKNQYTASGYQPYAVRARYLSNKYTIKEIKAIVTDPDKFGDLPHQDGMIMRHLANTVVGEEIGIERERLVDRIDGKATQPLDISGAIPVKIVDNV